jgi:AbrB family looped-hinge helix DNA binding protein
MVASIASVETRTRRRHPWTSSVTTKGQVTIPADIRKVLGVGPHDEVTFWVRDGRVEIWAGRQIASLTAGMAKSRVPALTPREENEAFERAMAEEADKPRK